MEEGPSHHHRYGRGPHPCDLTRCEFVLSYQPAALQWRFPVFQYYRNAT